MSLVGSTVDNEQKPSKGNNKGYNSRTSDSRKTCMPSPPSGKPTIAAAQPFNCLMALSSGLISVATSGRDIWVLFKPAM